MNIPEKLKIFLAYLFILTLGYFYLTPHISPNVKSSLYNDTRKLALKGTITNTAEGRDFHVYINFINYKVYLGAGTIIFESTPNKEEYGFCIGDSIYKKNDNDTFYVYRGKDEFEYVLP